MKRTITTAALTLTLALALPASASAAPVVRECGDYNMDTRRLTFGAVPVGAYLVNVTTRVASCRTALRLIRSRSGRLPGYRCVYRQTAIEETDVRCSASGGRVIRYQTGA